MSRPYLDRRALARLQAYVDELRRRGEPINLFGPKPARGASDAELALDKPPVESPAPTPGSAAGHGTPLRPESSR
jgi:hypothetical protein